MDARQVKVDSASMATSTSAGAQIEEFRRWLAQQRARRPERVATLNATTKADRTPPADQPLLISGTPLE